MNTAVYQKKRTPFYIFASIALFLAAIIEIYILFNNIIFLREIIAYHEGLLKYLEIYNLVLNLASVAVYIIMPICLLLDNTRGLLFKITACVYVGIKLPHAIYYIIDLFANMLTEMELIYFAESAMYLFLIFAEIFLVLRILLENKMEVGFSFLPGGLMFFAFCFRIVYFILYLDLLTDQMYLETMGSDFYINSIIHIALLFILAVAYVFIDIHLIKPYYDDDKAPHERIESDSLRYAYVQSVSQYPHAIQTAQVYVQQPQQFVPQYTPQQPMQQQASVVQKNEPKAPEYIDEIKRLKELYDNGVITEEEFSLKKKQILGI